MNNLFPRFAVWLILALTITACGSPQPAHAATKAQGIQFLLSQVRTSTTSLAGGKVYFYSPGTTTAKAVWTDRNKTAQAANPYTLDANGTAQLYGDGLYRIVIKTAALVTVYDRDNQSFKDKTNDAYDVADYASLAAAVASIGSTPATLQYAADQTLTANLAIPANIELMPLNGAKIIHAAYTVSVASSTARWPDAQIFNGTGAVTGLKKARPQWFYSGSGSWASAFQKAINSGAHTVSVPEGTYDFLTSNVSITGTSSQIDGVSIVGLSTFRTTKIIYSGTGYAIDYQGAGDEGTAPITRFRMENIWIDGGNNTDSLGGLRTDRCYIVDIRNCAVQGFGKTGGSLVSAQNVFNWKWEGGQISGNYPTASASNGITVGSTGASAWNTSNVQIKNTLIQRCNIGLNVNHTANLMDNLLVDNTSFGTNTTAHIYSPNANVSNITLTNNHFESTAAGTGVNIRKAVSVVMRNNYSQNALKHVYLEDVDGFELVANKLANGTAIAGDTGIHVKYSAGPCRGSISGNSINTSEITTAYNIEGAVGVDWGIIVTSEASWAYYASKASTFKGAIFFRYEREPYTAMWTSPDGVEWYNYVMSLRTNGEASSIPTTGAYVRGGTVANLEPVELGAGGSKYVNIGWMRMTTGSGHVLNTDWMEMRTLTGN